MKHLNGTYHIYTGNYPILAVRFEDDNLTDIQLLDVSGVILLKIIKDFFDENYIRNKITNNNLKSI